MLFTCLQSMSMMSMTSSMISSCSRRSMCWCKKVILVNLPIHDVDDVDVDVNVDDVNVDDVNVDDVNVDDVDDKQDDGEL